MSVVFIRPYGCIIAITYLMEAVPVLPLYEDCVTGERATSYR